MEDKDEQNNQIAQVDNNRMSCVKYLVFYLTLNVVQKNTLFLFNLLIDWIDRALKLRTTKT